MIIVETFNCVDGFHFYPEAPQEVAFLRNNHRHQFHIRTTFQVEDSNREIEIFMMQDKIRNFLEGKYGSPCNFQNMSCEMIAQDICDHFSAVKCIVLEDGCGGGGYVRG